MASYGLPPLKTLPPISSLHTLSTDERAQILDELFEPITALHTLSLSLLSDGGSGGGPDGNQYKSYDDLISDIKKQLYALLESSSTSDDEWLLKILVAHPRLGAPKEGLSNASKLEQAHLQQQQQQQQQQGSEEAKELVELNKKYEETFPGMIYVTFVNGRSRPVIFEDMRSRIARKDITAEKKDAIEAMCDIASDRAKKLQASTQ